MKAKRKSVVLEWDGCHNSAEAHDCHESSGAAEKQRNTIYAEVCTFPGRTAREIENITGIQAHKRTKEIEELGMIFRGDSRRCKVSGRTALTWWPT